jgi:NAD+ synthase (glutamine-hydrolysing)
VGQIRVALCQANTIVGDLEGNAALVRRGIAAAEQVGAQLVVFPELAVSGYPPEDLVLKPGFVSASQECTASLAATVGAVTAVIGFVDGDREGNRYNAAAVCREGIVVGTYRKRRLPNYSVFDEERYFTPGEGTFPVYDVDGVAVGVSICEDAWAQGGPLARLAEAGAEVIVNINASPFYQGRLAERTAELEQRAAETGRPILYVNQVGGQDELVFDGGSLAMTAAGQVAARSPLFEEHLLVVDVVDGEVRPVTVPAVAPAPDRLEELWAALVLGTGDYVRKNGFSDVVVGLSGGIDSALVAVIAADALGADHVHTVALPSRYTSATSLADAAALAEIVGTDHRVIDIEPAHVALLDVLAPAFAGRPPDVTEENLQARIRGTLLKSLENKMGWLLLSTGNKSEMAVGFSTLYGDMNGGFNPVKDVLKTTVFELARWRNEVAVTRVGRPAIPAEILVKPPSAELRPDQRDDQTLPPYEKLDPIVEAYVEGDATVAELVEAGHPEDLVRRVARLVDRAEYKRRQAPPGVRVTFKAFGKDRRMPITNKYTG